MPKCKECGKKFDLESDKQEFEIYYDGYPYDEELCARCNMNNTADALSSYEDTYDDVIL